MDRENYEFDEGQGLQDGDWEDRDEWRKRMKT